jgi:hypothetical protein
MRLEFTGKNHNIIGEAVPKLEVLEQPQITAEI